MDLQVSRVTEGTRPPAQLRLAWAPAVEIARLADPSTLVQHLVRSHGVDYNSAAELASHLQSGGLKAWAAFPANAPANSPLCEQPGSSDYMSRSTSGEFVALKVLLTGEVSIYSGSRASVGDDRNEVEFTVRRLNSQGHPRLAWVTVPLWTRPKYPNSH